MTKIIKGQIVILSAMLAFLVLALTSCGGGTSTAGGGSGGSTLRGTVASGVAAVDPSTGSQSSFLLAAANLLVEPAHAAGVPDVTVQLVSGGTIVATTTTDANGNFVFNNVAPGDYTIRLSQGGTALGETSALTVGASTSTQVELSLGGDVMSLEVEAEAEGNQVSGNVEADTSSDDNSADDAMDDNSNDDESADDNASEDESGDDSDSGDDDSNDDDS